MLDDTRFCHFASVIDDASDRPARTEETPLRTVGVDALQPRLVEARAIFGLEVVPEVCRTKAMSEALVGASWPARPMPAVRMAGNSEHKSRRMRNVQLDWIENSAAWTPRPCIGVDMAQPRAMGRRTLKCALSSSAGKHPGARSGAHYRVMPEGQPGIASRTRPPSRQFRNCSIWKFLLECHKGNGETAVSPQPHAAWQKSTASAARPR